MTPKQAKDILGILGNLTVAELQPFIDEFYSDEKAHEDHKKFPKQDLVNSYAVIRKTHAPQIIDNLPTLLAHEQHEVDLGRVVGGALIQASRRHGISLQSEAFHEVVRTDDAGHVWMHLGKVKEAAAQSREGGRVQGA